MTYPTGPKLDLDSYERTQLPAKKAAKQASWIRAARREIQSVRATRHFRHFRHSGDPLAARDNDLRLRDIAWRKEQAREAKERAEAQARRATLLAAAREARKMGFDVRSSKDRGGRVSSYYCRRGAGIPLRISDHEIPANDRRDFMAACHGRGGWDGYPGPELLIAAPRRATWLRRAIVLAAAGRSVPGAD